MVRKIIVLFFLFSGSLLAQDTTVYIMIDEPVSTIPQNFRKCSSGLIRQYDKMPDTTGLNGACLSGSAEFGELNFPQIVKEIRNQQIIVVDLRQETHFLVNGITISWYGQYDWADVGLNMGEVLVLEKKRIDSVKNAGSIKVIRVIRKDRSSGTFSEVKDTVLNVKSVCSEEEFVNSAGHGYFRITVTDRRKPTEGDADRFIKFVNTLSPEVWLHFHCHAGDGRTTTFMTMYDMMQNSKNVSYDDIIMRQYLIGGIDLNHDSDYPDYEKPYAYERTEFLKRFYQYCSTNNDGFKTSFSSWLKK